jgi:hypothetical protein
MRRRVPFLHNGFQRQSSKRIDGYLLGFVVLFLLGINFNVLAQLTYLPLDQYYRDRTFGVTLEGESNQNFKNQPYRFGGFFPAFEHQSFQLSALNASQNRGTWLGRKLFDEHFFEFKNDEVFINFDILADLSIGRDSQDPMNKQYYYNTRGIQVNGGIGKYFGFFSTLRENQARFLDYQVKELRKGGTISTTQNGNLTQGGAFVSGAGRTKPFQDNAYDFAFVTGALFVKPSKNLIITFGNNPLFIGAGHRSLFYSDHSNMFPHVRFSWEISKYINAQIVYAQHNNLIKMALNTPGTERLFEKKGYTLKYINFIPFKSLQFSLFEGSSWLRYDNNNIERVHPLYYNPIPFLNPAILGQKGTNAHILLGMQAIWNVWHSIHLYSQFAFDNIGVSDPSVQVGMRFSEPLKIKNLHLQFEANRIPAAAYQHENRRLNYINNNVSLAHPLGAGVEEILGRINYEWKRIGFLAQANIIRTVQNTQNSVNGIPLTPLTISIDASYTPTIIGFTQFDLFYRFNKRSNLQIFTSMIYRRESLTNQTNNTLYFGFGMRTALSNRYFDL